MSQFLGTRNFNVYFMVQFKNLLHVIDNVQLKIVNTEGRSLGKECVVCTELVVFWAGRPHLLQYCRNSSRLCYRLASKSNRHSSPSYRQAHGFTTTHLHYVKWVAAHLYAFPRIRFNYLTFNHRSFIPFNFAALFWDFMQRKVRIKS